MKFGSMEERFLLDRIARLQREYEAMAKPYVDRLVAINAMRPSNEVLFLQSLADAPPVQVGELRV